MTNNILYASVHVMDMLVLVTFVYYTQHFRVFSDLQYDIKCQLNFK